MPQHDTPPWERDDEGYAGQQSKPVRSNYPARTHASTPARTQGAVARASGVANLTFTTAGNPIFQDDVQRHAYMASMLATGLLPKHIQTPAQAVLAMRACENAGLAWETWIGKTYTIGGQLAVYVSFHRAAAERTGELEYVRMSWFDSQGEEKTERNAATWEVFTAKAEVKRKGVDVVQACIYSKKDAETAGLTNKNANYRNNLADMLMWRAMGRALQIVFPLVCDGLLTQGIDDMIPMYDQEGRAVATADGAKVLKSRIRHLSPKENLRGEEKASSQDSDQKQSKDDGPEESA